MIRESDGKIGTREFFAVISFAIGLKLTDTTPVLLIEDGRNAVWIVLIIGMLIILPSFLVLLKLLKKYKNKSIIEIFYTILGKYLGFITGITFFLIAFMGVLIQSRENIDIIDTLFYARTPKVYLYVFMLLTVWLVAKKGFETIARCCWFTFTPLLIVVLILIVISVKYINLNYLFPLAGPGISKLALSGFNYSSVLSDLFVLATMFPYVRSFEQYKKASLMGLVFSVLIFSFFMVIYTTVFGYPRLSILNFPYQQLTKMVHIGIYANNLDSFFFAFWVIALILKFSIYFYTGAAVLGHIFGIKEFEKLILPLCIIVLVVGMQLGNYAQTTELYRNYLLMGASIYFFMLPLFLWIVDRIRRDKRSDTAKEA
jgi:spore germination protein KB